MNIYYDNELNEKIYKRNIPGQSLKPNYSFRPQSTKYSHFQIIDKDDKSNVPLMKYDKVIYNPAQRGPTDEYFQKVDLESQLRSQTFALQKDSQSCYVPNYNGSLYNNPMNYDKEYTQFIPQINKNCNITKGFNYSTRYHLKEK